MTNKTSIDEVALAKVQNDYADKNGKYKDMSIREIIEAYKSAEPSICIQCEHSLNKLDSDEMVEKVADKLREDNYALCAYYCCKEKPCMHCKDAISQAKSAIAEVKKALE